MVIANLVRILVAGVHDGPSGAATRFLFCPAVPLMAVAAG